MPAAYFYRLHLDDDHVITEFCVANHTDPRQFVETLAPDGTPQRWESHEEGNLLVFSAPDGYAGFQGVLWCYDRRLQEAVPMPRDQLEGEAIRWRTSVVMPALAEIPAVVVDERRRPINLQDDPCPSGSPATP